MASSTMPIVLSLLLVLCFPYTIVVVSAGQAPCGYKRLFSLGDSITDTGNLARVTPNISTMAFPYGETFFHRPTGRFCDGRLILPLLTPFLAGKTAEDFRQGANFAVASATALSLQYFKDMGLDVKKIPPFSLDVQVEWFKRVLHMLGPTEQAERKEIMSNSLFLLGEIGGNDYNHPFFQNRSFSAEIKPLVPKVIAKIENAIKELISIGAKTIIVPGNFPIGCMARYLTKFKSNNPSDYDGTGCIRWLNDFAEEHNRALRLMLERIALKEDPSVTVIYGDYYSAVLELINSPRKHGMYHHHVTCHVLPSSVWDISYH
ncbi:hypothetical protein HU200_016563 [Digitaria exilis]|uniref:Uncharacterized protein n=1 Tax=Digitaria exilis TaxID=1010633 RepID=A0A835KHZ2_9POAL|nr:hypothetical protein HU200_016563 [Digitaria exilis]